MKQVLLERNDPRRVRIVEQPADESEKFDVNGDEIIHTVLIVRWFDSTILGKYQDEEVSQVFVNEKNADPKKPAKRKLVTKKISGIDAAKAACVVNGWVETNF